MPSPSCRSPLCRCGSNARYAGSPLCRRGTNARCADCPLCRRGSKARGAGSPLCKRDSRGAWFRIEARCAGVIPEVCGTNRTPVVEAWYHAGVVGACWWQVGGRLGPPNTSFKRRPLRVYEIGAFLKVRSGSNVVPIYPWRLPLNSTVRRHHQCPDLPKALSCGIFFQRILKNRASCYTL